MHELRQHLYGALLVAMLVVCCVCAECGGVYDSRWLAGCMGFLWVTGFSFFHCVASPFHSFVTTTWTSACMHAYEPSKKPLQLSAASIGCW